MNKDDIIRIAREAGFADGVVDIVGFEGFKHLTELIVKECIDKIETYRIPVGSSAAGEMACEMTYKALKEIRDEIKEHFGIKSRPWVGLTNEEIDHAAEQSDDYAAFIAGALFAQNKLKEKNK
jgi:hypothetical protein